MITKKVRKGDGFVGADFNPEVIIYKTDISADELVGYMFLFKLIYDIIVSHSIRCKRLYKYNISSYELDRCSNPYCMQGSTTYTLPFWLGMCHGMLAE